MKFISIRATLTNQHDYSTKEIDYKGSTEGLVDWIDGICFIGSSERIVGDLYRYGVADSGWTRFSGV